MRISFKSPLVPNHKGLKGDQGPWTLPCKQRKPCKIFKHKNVTWGVSFFWGEGSKFYRRNVFHKGNNYVKFPAFLNKLVFVFFLMDGMVDTKSF